MTKLVIIHGWGKGISSWQKVKEELEKAKIEVLLPELPGFGNTFPPLQVWGIEEYKNWILNFIEKKEWQKFCLLGHSFGGGIALKIACDCPEKIEKLILVSPAIKRKKSKKISFFIFLAKKVKKFLSFLSLENIKKLGEKLFRKITSSSDYWQAKGIMKKVFKKVISQDLSFYLQKIKIPTIIIWGEKDRIISLKEGLKLKKEIKNCQFIILKKIGHNPHFEIPEKFSQEIIKIV